MNVNQAKSHIRTALGRVGLGLAVVTVAVSVSTASFAVGTSQQRTACMPDVLRLCFTSIAQGDQAIIACMTKKRHKLSWSCKRTLPPI